MNEPRDGSVILDNDGTAWQRGDRHTSFGEHWYVAGDERPSTWEFVVAHCTPLVVIHEGPQEES